MLSYRKLAMRVLGRPLYTERGSKMTRPASQRAAALALTAAIMTGAAFPAFAGTYFIGDGDITVTANEDGTAEVRRGDTVVSANDDNVVIKGGYSTSAGSKTLEAVGGPAIAIDMGDEVTYTEPTPVVTWPDPADEAEETEKPEDAPAEPEETPAEEPSDTPEETPTEDAPEETPAEAEQPAPAQSKAVTLEAKDDAPEAPAEASDAPEKDDKDDDKEVVTYEAKTPVQSVAKAAANAVSNVIKIINNVKDKTLKVTLEDVNIDVSSKVNPDPTATGNDSHYAAVSVSGSGDTVIELNGDNELKSGRNRAGLEHNQTVNDEGNVTSGKLTIQDENEDGSLTATGGQFAAGIGGASANAGQVTITGGNITAIGIDGAGIGGGQGKRDSNAGNADIEISGGTIEAIGGDASAGIGGGTWGNANIKITDNAVIKSAVGGGGGAGIGGGQWGNGNVTITDDSKIENAQGGGMSAGIGGGVVGNGTVSISGNATINAQGGEDGAGIGGGYGYSQSGTGDITIEGSTTVNATGGMGSAGIGNGTDAGGNNGQITIRGTKDSSPTVNATGGIAEEDGQGYVGPGGAGIGGGSTTDSEYTPVSPDITIEGTVNIVAKAGEGNAAIGDMNGEQVFTGLDGSITRYDSEGNDTTLPTDPGYPVPEDTSSSGGGSAALAAPEAAYPGLVVTDKDGQRISYTSIRGNSVLSIRVGRFTASLHAPLSVLRQLRADGIETITFQTILHTTTLSVDELLAMGGADAEAVLTHRFAASSLTVG